MWDDYLEVPFSPECVDECRDACSAAFELQREHMQMLMSTLKPRGIACLGAGVLNDIPIDSFIVGGAQVYLVDWIPDVSREGFRGRLIAEDGDGYDCLLCEERCASGNFCAAFQPPVHPVHRVCHNFVLAEGAHPRCENYAPGPEPHFVTGDVTGGRAQRFAESLPDIVREAKTPARAFRKAISHCQRCATVNERLDIEAGSQDLVTSSMMVSQFEHEPYTFFAKLMEEHFGRKSIEEKTAELTPLLEQLRSDLFQVQMDGHVRELYRLVDKDRGKVYFSVELFHARPADDKYFLLHESPAVLDTLSKYFHFDFSFIPPQESLKEVTTGQRPSIVQSFVLHPIENLEKAAAF